MLMRQLCIEWSMSKHSTCEAAKVPALQHVACSSVLGALQYVSPLTMLKKLHKGLAEETNESQT